MPTPTKISQLTNTMTTTALTDLVPIVNDVGGTPETQKIAVPNLLDCLSYGQISGNPLLASGGQVIANTATANLTAGSIGDFWGTAGATRNMATDLPNGRLTPAITGYFRVWGHVSCIATPNGSVTGGGFRVKVRYNGADVAGLRTTVGFLGDASTGDAARVLHAFVEGVVDVSTASQHLTLAIETLIIAGATATTQFSFNVVDCCLGAAWLAPT